MRELRRQGYDLKRIAEIVAFSPSTVYKYTKDIKMQVGRYQKNILSGIFNGTIIDIETTGLEPEYDEIITFGWLVKNVICVIQRFEASLKEFYGIIKEELTILPKPLYAYNAEFERKFLQVKIEKDLEIIDVFQPWKERAESRGFKWPKLDEIAPVPYEYLDERQVSAHAVITCWKKYLMTRKPKQLNLIVKHNMRDLRQTLSLLAYI